MSKLFNIDENERSRILMLHEAQKVLPVTIVTNYDNTYDYKKEGSQYFYKKKGTQKWIKVSDKGLNAVRKKVFKDSKSGPTLSANDINKTDKSSSDTTQDSSSEESWFSKASKKLGQFWTNTKSMVFPVHWRIFYDFLTLRRKPFTVTDLSNEEQEALRQMIEYGYANKFRDGSVMNFYDIANKMNKLNNSSERIDFRNKKDLGFNQLGIQSLYMKVAMTLGNATVKRTGNGWNIKDIYDFNNYYEHPEKYTLEQMPNTMKDSVQKIMGGNYLQGIEQMAAYFQKLGYKGIEVNIDLPSQ